MTAEGLAQVLREGFPEDARMASTAAATAQQVLRDYASASATTATSATTNNNAATAPVDEPLEGEASAMICGLTLQEFSRAVAEDTQLWQLGRW
jgi:hypothetical protein